MRTKLLAFLLISSFVAGSLPAFAEEPALLAVPEPVGSTVVEVGPISEPTTEPTPETDVIEATVTEAEDLTTGALESEPLVITAEAATATTSEPTASTTEEVFTSIPLAATATSSEVTGTLAATTTASTTPPTEDSGETLVLLNIDASIALPNGCEVTDAGGVTHVFPQATSTEYLAICALAKAKQDGAIADFVVTDSTWGLSVTSVNEIAPGATEYWALYVNDGYAGCGVECLPLAVSDTLAFVLTDYTNEATSSSVTLAIDSLVETHHNVIVPSWCDITDTTGAALTYPKEGAPDYVAICALAAAQAEGKISDYTVTDSSWGLSVTSVNGIAHGETEYWALWLNEAFADCGVECLAVGTGDVLTFVLTDFGTNEEKTRTSLRIIGTTDTPKEAPGDGSSGDGSSGGGESPDPVSFDEAGAYDFLASGQQSDGSWDSELVTDWAALSLGISGAPSSMKSALASHLKRDATRLQSVLDYERHAMALMALGINPYTGGPSDYVTPIVDSFDGRQIDDANLVNDDIFALIVLLNAGHDESDEMIQEIASFIVDEQNGNGSWENSADMTAAGVQALAEVSSLPGVSEALADARSYLKTVQQEDGGFNDPHATAWVLQAIEALGDSTADWKTGSGKTPLDYLVASQQDDGGMTTTPSDYSTRAWATAYALPAVKGLTWDDVLRNFEKPDAAADDRTSGNGKNAADEDAEQATSTEPIAAPEPALETATTSPVVADAVAEPVPQPIAPTTRTVLATAVEPQTRAVTAEPAPAPEQETAEGLDTSSALTASAIDSGAWEAIKSFFAGIWAFVAGLFS